MKKIKETFPELKNMNVQIEKDHIKFSTQFMKIGPHQDTLSGLSRNWDFKHSVNFFQREKNYIGHIQKIRNQNGVRLFHSNLINQKTMEQSFQNSEENHFQPKTLYPSNYQTTVKINTSPLRYVRAQTFTIFKKLLETVLKANPES